MLLFNIDLTMLWHYHSKPLQWMWDFRISHWWQRILSSGIRCHKVW